MWLKEGWQLKPVSTYKQLYKLFTLRAPHGKSLPSSDEYASMNSFMNYLPWLVPPDENLLSSALSPSFFNYLLHGQLLVKVV
jgi:hypothetical protein